MMKKKYLIHGIVVGLFVVGALLILNHKEIDCICKEDEDDEGWGFCCGY